jgi:hypothetical protein
VCSCETTTLIYRYPRETTVTFSKQCRPELEDILLSLKLCLHIRSTPSSLIRPQYSFNYQHQHLKHHTQRATFETRLRISPTFIVVLIVSHDNVIQDRPIVPSYQ